MNRFGRFRESMRILAAVAAVSAGGGAVYGALLGADEPFFGALQGVVTGLSIAVPIVVFEIYVTSAQSALPLRRLPFVPFTAFRVAAYVAIIIIGIYLGRWVFQSWTHQSLGFDRELAVTIGMSLLAGLFFNLFFIVERLLGRGVLWRFATGRYHQPRMEDRVFLFVDLVASTELTEQLGDIAYHRLLNRFLFDLSHAQLASRGEIYKYLGDGIIITWPHARGIAHANCLRCLQRLDVALARSASEYQAQFGTVPDYRAGLHAGPVVAGELGDFKQEIGYLGDAINTAARIEEACRATGHRVLISASLAAEMTPPPGLALEPIGPVTLRGKIGQLELCAVIPGVQP